MISELDIEKEEVFLNYKEGGYIYISVDKENSTMGFSDVDDCMLRLKVRNMHSIIKVMVVSGIGKQYSNTKYGKTSRGAFKSGSIVLD